jgi:hypothetical protein
MKPSNFALDASGSDRLLRQRVFDTQPPYSPISKQGSAKTSASRWPMTKKRFTPGPDRAAAEFFLRHREPQRHPANSPRPTVKPHGNGRKVRLETNSPPSQPNASPAKPPTPPRAPPAPRRSRSTCAILGCISTKRRNCTTTTSAATTAGRGGIRRGIRLGWMGGGIGLGMRGNPLSFVDPTGLAPGDTFPSRDRAVLGGKRQDLTPFITTVKRNKRMVKRRNSPYASHDRAAPRHVPMDCSVVMLDALPVTVRERGKIV